MTSLTGSRTAIILLTLSFKSSLIQYSSIGYSTEPCALVTPTSSTNILIASGVNPLLLKAAIDTSLGSSHPSTIPSSTSFLIYLLPVTTLVRYNFANSICLGFSSGDVL